MVTLILASEPLPLSVADSSSFHALLSNTPLLIFVKCPPRPFNFSLLFLVPPPRAPRPIPSSKFLPGGPDSVCFPFDPHSPYVLIVADNHLPPSLSFFFLFAALFYTPLHPPKHNLRHPKGCLTSPLVPPPLSLFVVNAPTFFNLHFFHLSLSKRNFFPLCYAVD